MWHSPVYVALPLPRVHSWPLGGFWAGGTGCSPGRCPWNGAEPRACLFQPHLLPTVEGKDPGLKYISSETLRGLQPLPGSPEGLPARSPPVPRVSPPLVTRSPRSWRRGTSAAASRAASSRTAAIATSTRGATSRSEAPRGPGAGRKGGVRRPGTLRGAEPTARGRAAPPEGTELSGGVEQPLCSAELSPEGSIRSWKEKGDGVPIPRVTVLVGEAWGQRP